MTASEKRHVESCLASRPEWRTARKNAEELLNTFQELPPVSPSDQVWKQISASISQTNQRTVWFPWYYAHPFWAQSVKMASACFVVFITAFMIYSQSTQDPYDLIVMEDSNGFGFDAETYVAHHDVCAEPFMALESLIAYYTYVGKDD